ncbi:MAG: hypothetical protein FJY79_07005 [Candidatus Aminicenantes bacterium]|nr:hypothetical protein [Candidatus Aminicenantes bacterium]
MKTFIAAFFGALVSPGRTLKGLSEARGRIRKAAAAVLFAGFLYALTSLGLGAAGAVPLWPVMGGLGTDNYYFWQMVIVLPGAVLAWALAAALLHGMTRSGGFTRALAVAGPALSAPLFVAWLPAAVQAVFMALGMGQREWAAILSEPGPWQTLYIAGYGLAALMALRAFAAAAGVLRKRPGAAGLVSGSLTAIVVIAIFLALVR